MSEEFKLEFNPGADGRLSASFQDSDRRYCSLWESAAMSHVYLGPVAARMYLTRQMAKEIGRALWRFARTGSLREPGPEKQLENFTAAMDEFDEYDGQCIEIVKLAREYARLNSAYVQTYRSDAAHETRKPFLDELHRAEDPLCTAVETLETWRKQHGWEEK